MRLIESKVEYIPQGEGLDGIYEQIEKCGRTCYKSEDKITKGSAQKFVERMINGHHTAMLEHGTVYLQRKVNDGFTANFLRTYEMSPYSRFNRIVNRVAIISTNFRVLVENNRIKDLQYLCDPTEFHEKRYTFKFTCSRAIANELIRHRVFSFAQESQRYCGYDKKKFNGEISFIIPSHFKWNGETYYNFDDFYAEQPKGNIGLFLNILLNAEEGYMYMRDNGWTPQQARDILPNATKTELCMTGFASDWRHLLDLRLFERTGIVHPDMKLLMQKLEKVMKDNNIWDDVMRYKSKFE